MAGHHQAQLRALRGYVAEHGIVPSLAHMARLWGYASKTSAARIVRDLVRDGILVRTPAGRLREGPEFAAALPPAAARQEAIARAWKVHWQPDALAEAYDIATRFSRIAQLIDQHARRTAQLNGLTVGELLVLDVLHRMGPPYTCAPTMLRHHFALTLPGVGKRLANLQRQGLIDRVASRTDKRSLLVALNDRGRARLEQAALSDVGTPHIRWAMELGNAQREGLIRVLRSAAAAIETDCAPAPRRGGAMPKPS